MVTTHQLNSNRGITKPKTKAQLLKEAYTDLVNADEEIAYWTKKKQDAEREIERVTDKEIYKGSDTKSGREDSSE